jgi:hypothetical protein
MYSILVCMACGGEYGYEYEYVFFVVNFSIMNMFFCC